MKAADEAAFVLSNEAMAEIDRERALWVLMPADATLVAPEATGWRMLSGDEYRWSGVEVASEHFLGRLDGQPVCLAELAEDSPLVDGWKPLPLRTALPILSRQQLVITSRAQQIHTWSHEHRWCGRCGGGTEVVNDGDRCCRCSRCGALWYPRVTPCVIMLLVRGEELLLGRNANFPGRFFSTLAGFVEPGERLEDALVREVFEETGVTAANPRYFNSQPWPFPSQIMLGFFADHAAGEPVPDGKEIVEAGWYHYSDLPQVPGPGLSIAGELIAEAVRKLSQGQRP